MISYKQHSHFSLLGYVNIPENFVRKDPKYEATTNTKFREALSEIDIPCGMYVHHRMFQQQYQEFITYVRENDISGFFTQIIFILIHAVVHHQPIYLTSINPTREKSGLFLIPSPTNL